MEGVYCCTYLQNGRQNWLNYLQRTIILTNLYKMLPTINRSTTEKSNFLHSADLSRRLPSPGPGLLHKIRPNFLEASQQFSFLQGGVVAPRPTPILEDQAPVFISPRGRVAQLYPRAPGTHFSRFLRHTWVTVDTGDKMGIQWDSTSAVYYRLYGSPSAF
jgi:hypothetical protein